MNANKARKLATNNYTKVINLIKQAAKEGEFEIRVDNDEYEDVSISNSLIKKLKKDGYKVTNYSGKTFSYYIIDWE